MIIDSSYFIGDINVPNTDDSSVLTALNANIVQYEKKILMDSMEEAWHYSRLN